MFDTEPKIVTAFDVGQREAKLVITNHIFRYWRQGSVISSSAPRMGFRYVCFLKDADHWIVSIWKKSEAKSLKS